MNSPGPEAIGGGALGGMEGGVAHGEGAGNGGGAAGGAADAPGCASDCNSCVNPPAAAGAAGAGGGGGVGEIGVDVIGPNELAASGAGSFGLDSWFSAWSSCVNPPAAAGACGGAAGDGGEENCSPLAGACSCFSDLSGSSCGAGLAPWLANIRVKAPGSDCGATCGEGGGVGAGEAGPEVMGAIPPELENIFVNSPGADCGATCGEGGVGVGETGPEVMGAIPPELENIFVNSPGADWGAACGGGGVGVGEVGVVVAAAAAGSGVALPPMELNMRVNAPGADEPAWPALSALAGAVDAVEIPTVGSYGGFSIATGLKTRATSSVFPALAPGAALEPAAPPAAGMVSACSMRVNSPGLREGSGCDEGGGAVCFTGSGASETAGGAGALAGFGDSVSAGFFSDDDCPKSEASKSSSARGAAATCPKTPVALEGWSVLGESEESNGFLGASMGGHLAC